MITPLPFALSSFARLVNGLILSAALLVAPVQVFATPTDEAQLEFDKVVGADLLSLQRYEVSQKNPEQIRKMNEHTFSLLNSYVPRASADRVQAISLDYAQLALTSINLNPVVSEYRIYDYRNGLSIGFCFGRATYVHLALLRAGVNKLSIKKIWAVGPMSTGDTDWQFHVATAVLAEDGKWYAIDTFVGQVMTVEAWFERMQKVALNETLRFYVSSPSKFSVSLGTYSRVELGLDLNEEQDWYSHYFKNLMTWMATKPLADVGLYDLRSDETN